jgi:hypothetical protein
MEKTESARDNSEPSRNEPEFDQEKIHKLLRLGKAVELNQFTQYLNKAAAGELSPQELKAFKALRSELENAFEERKEKIFPHLIAVLQYLNEQGWKIKKSAIYQHNQLGKIKPNASGVYSLSDVEKYATLHLKKSSETLASEEDPEIDQLLKRNAELDVLIKEEKHDHWKKRNLRIEEEVRIQVAKECVNRFRVLMSDLQNFARGEAPTITHVVEGKPEKIPDLIDFLSYRFNQFMARYDADKEFTTEDDLYTDLQLSPVP